MNVDRRATNKDLIILDQASYLNLILINKRKAMSHYHAVVWIDHAEAHVMHISPASAPASSHRQR